MIPNAGIVASGDEDRCSSRLVMQSLDESLQSYATENDLLYSRYADDLVLYSKNAFDRSLATQHIKAIHECLVEGGFWLNNAKTKIITPGTRKIVLGLLVDGERPRLPKSYKKYVSGHLYYLAHPEIDALAHAECRGFQSPPRAAQPCQRKNLLRLEHRAGLGQKTRRPAQRHLQGA